jgi:hypothetical protein
MKKYDIQPNFGCLGGYIFGAYKYILKYPIFYEDDYPYSGE